MKIIATNGKEYEVRFNNDQNLEIQRFDEQTELEKVFVFKDLSIGNFESGRREAIFYSYEITPSGERINRQRHSFRDTDSEFAAFLQSTVWDTLKKSLVTGFLNKIEFTEIA